MEIRFNKVALQEYMDAVRTIGEQMRRHKDQSLNLYNSCKQKYQRIHSKLEEVERRTYNQVENSESMRRRAQLEYETAQRMYENAADEDEKTTAMRRMQQAQRTFTSANEEYVKASAIYLNATKKVQNLSVLWEMNKPNLEAQAYRVEAGMASFLRLTKDSNYYLGEYMSFMDKAKGILNNTADINTDSSSGIPVSVNVPNLGQAETRERSMVVQSKGNSSDTSEISKSSLQNNFSGDTVEFGLPIGWCISNSMTAVGINECGQKVVSMTIGGIERSYRCTMSGMAKAYRHAKASGDLDMIARTSAMFEIETLREDLELGNGEAGFAQLGGYHKDVKKQDPVGYESHHIPSQGTQDEDGKMLPTISITYDDHKLTSSFAGKQRKTYQPAFPTEIPLTSYKESIIHNLEQGSSGYVDSIKCELLDLRSTTGHRYDGGVSAYLDTVIDMLSTRGIPKVKKGD